MAGRFAGSWVRRDRQISGVSPDPIWTKPIKTGRIEWSSRTASLDRGDSSGGQKIGCTLVLLRPSPAMDCQVPSNNLSTGRLDLRVTEASSAITLRHRSRDVHVPR